MRQSPYRADLLLANEPIESYVEPIARAFEDYVVMRHAFAECPGPRIDWIRRMLRGGYSAKRTAGIPIPVVRCDGDVVGSANLYLPNVQVDEETKSWWPRFLDEAGEGTARFFGRFFEITESVELPPNILLGMIGVVPEHQGRGAGRTLLEYVIAMAEANPVAQGVALDTEVEENVGLYERFGFQVRGQGSVDEMPIWVMFRPNGMS